MKKFYALLALIVCASFVLKADSEPNGSTATANTIPLNAIHNGSLSLTDTDDYYKLTTPKNGRLLISVNCSVSPLSTRIYFYNADGSYLTNTGAAGDSTKIAYDCYGKGDLYVRVNRAGGDGAYQVKVDHKPISLPIDPGEPNNSTLTSVNLNAGVFETGHLGYVNGSSVPLDADDYYIGNLPVNGKITVTVVTTNTLTSRIYLYNDAGSYLTNTGASDTTEITYDCLLSGNLYFRVSRAGGCGSYTINWSYVGTTYPPDPEPNGSIASAMPIAEDAIETGHMGYINASLSDVDDYYAVYLPKDGKIDISLNTFETLTGLIYLYNAAGSYLTNTGAGTILSLSYDCLLSDSVFIRVSRAGGCGSYTLSYDYTPTVLADDNEPNNSIAEALNLNMNTLKQGHMGYINASPSDTEDFYVVDSEAPGDLTFTVTFQESLSGRIYLYNSAGSYITNTGATSDSLSITYNAPVDDIYYFRISRAGGCGGYTVKAANGCPKPKNLRTDPVISVGALLKWNAVGVADKYRLQKRVVGAPSWEPNNNVNTPKYTWYPLNECTDYEFRVEARCGDRNSSFAPIEQFQTLCAPVCFTPTSVFVNATNATTAQIGWVGQPIDVGYKVQYVVDGDFSTIFEKTSTTPMILLNGLTPGTNYLFRVNAFCLGGGVSGFSLGSFSTTTVREGADGLANSEGIVLYPNPASKTVTVTLEEANSLIEVINAIGQVVLSQETEGVAAQLDISDLQAGFYQVRSTNATTGVSGATGLIVR